MINITSKALAALKDGTSQKVKISVSPLKGEAFELTNENLALNGLTIERLCVNGDEFETGTCCASTAKITLDNSRGSFNEVFFGGAVLSIKIGIEYENTVEWLPIGIYTVDEQPRKLSSITLEAYDNMVRLDIAAADLPLPASRRTLVRWCIEQAGLVCDDYSMFSDSSESGGYISSVPEFSEVPTLRQLIMYCCELDGVCGYTDGDGHIVFKDYGGNEAFGIDESFRYQTVNLEEADTVINGIRLLSGEEIYPADITGDYIIEISSNPLFDACDNKSKCAELLNAKFAGRAYRGFSCETLSLPFLQPLDAVSFIRNSVPYSSFVTNISYTLGGKTTIESKCISQTQKGYASLGALTSAQKGILNKAKHELKKDLSDREQAIIDLNEVVNSSLGFYTTTVKDPQTGAVRLYMHDKPTLEESGTIYTRTEKGFAWTNSGWNDGNPVWNYGIDKNGNAVLNTISVNKISGNYIKAGILTDSKNKNFWNLDTGEFKITDGLIDISASSSAENKILLNYFSSTLNTSYYIKIMPQGVVVGENKEGDITETFHKSDGFSVTRNNGNVISLDADGMIRNGKFVPLIIESGYKSGWNYRIWDDKTIECWTDTPVFKEIGFYVKTSSLWISNDAKIGLPFNMFISHADIGASEPWCWCNCMYNSDGDSSIKFRVFYADSGDPGKRNLSFTCHVIGQLKTTV